MSQTRTNSELFEKFLSGMALATGRSNRKNRRLTPGRSIAARWIGALLLTTVSGCFYIPTWRIPNYAPCQCLGNNWGCMVDHIEHQSPIDQPWCNPHYHPKGVYRVAIPGQWYPGDSADFAPHEMPPEAADGNLKPAIEAPAPQLMAPGIE